MQFYESFGLVFFPQLHNECFIQAAGPQPPPPPPPPHPPPPASRAAGPQLRLQISVGSAAVPNLNHERQSPVGTAGPQP